MEKDAVMEEIRRDDRDKRERKGDIVSESESESER